MLAIKGIAKTYATRRGPVQALAGVSLEVQAGQFVAIQGPSGCGKTTLLLAAGGLLEPGSGQVLVQEQDLYALSAEARARFRADHLGFVFQQFHLVPYLNVWDNILAPTLARPGLETAERARDLSVRLGLEPLRHHVPAQLSTGECQRTALARALLNRPQLLLADEPTGNLDPDNARIVFETLAQFTAGGGAVLLVTHSPAASQYADVVLRLVAGRLA